LLFYNKSKEINLASQIYFKLQTNPIAIGITKGHNRIQLKNFNIVQKGIKERTQKKNIYQLF